MEKSVMVVGIDDSEHSYYSLNWTLDHFFSPSPENSPFKLVIVNAKPSAAASTVGSIGPVGPGPIMKAGSESIVKANLNKIAVRVMEKAKEICTAKSVEDVLLEVVEGDARHVLCYAVEKHHASVLVVGCHGYGAIKRVVLGSVSDYCAHHAHCSVMIVKKPKIKT